MRFPLFGALVLALLGTVRADDEPLEFDLTSAYLPTSVAGGNLISIKGEIRGQAGKATLVVDPNSCGLDEFGDRTICTQIAPLPQQVSLQQLRTKDPTGKGRRLFSLTGQEFKGKFTLVVPRRPNGTYRLLHVIDNKTHVVSFEQPQRRRGGRGNGGNGAGNAPPKKELTCTELPQTVDGTTAAVKVTVKGKSVQLVVTGKTPHSNTTVQLNAVTYIRQPEYWQINVTECSEGPIRLPAIGKFSVTKDVSGLVGTKGIVLVFADGKSTKIDIERK